MPLNTQVKILFGLSMWGIVAGMAPEYSVSSAAQIEFDVSDSVRPMIFAGDGSRGHHVELITEPGAIGQAIGILRYEGQVWHVRDSECPRFRAELGNFQHLPTLRTGPDMLQPGTTPTRPISPYRIHGETWVIRTRMYAPDWSYVDAELTARQGPHAIWLSQLVDVIKDCTQPSPDLTAE